MSATTKKTLSHLIACFVLLTLAAIARADFTVTVTDNFPGHSPILRWDQFSTDLTATIHNPPASDAETTVTGPTYAWSINGQSPSSPAFPLPADSGNGNATLTSPAPTLAVCFVETGGTYDISVKCVVTYTRTDNKTGNQTPITASGTTDVTFFVRVPVKVIQTGPRNNQPYSGQPAPGQVGNWWGHWDTYPLQVQDNQGGAFPNGEPHETFTNINPVGFEPNGPGGGDTWPVGSDFTDNIVYLVNRDPGVVNQDTLEDSFDQPWHCMQQTPPYQNPPAYNGDTPLNTHHVADHFGYAVRTY